MKNQDSMRFASREIRDLQKKSFHEFMFIIITYFAFQNLDQLYVRLSLTLQALLFPFLPLDSPFNLSTFNCILGAVPSWFGLGFEGRGITVFGEALIYFQPRGTHAQITQAVYRNNNPTLRTAGFRDG